ncbi:MAG: UPF0280 family protein [Candidatus Omnitrophota bacterium]|jgi:hypothetical protein
MFKPRTYRKWVQSDDLVSFEVREKETDLMILARNNLEPQVRELILTYRGDIERYIKLYPDFYTSLEPLPVKDNAPDIVRAMSGAAKRAGVGPMASIAGAVAEFVGRGLLTFTDEVIVENGGDIFLKTSQTRKLGIYAGESSRFTGKLTLEVGPAENGIGVCTSSGTVSHSLSFGKADAVVIISDSTALADAAATAAGNVVKDPQDIEKGIEIARSIEGVKGVLIIVGDRMGSWGEIRLA